MVLGVSGGPDSMCLLWLLSRYDNLDLTVVHCNYQLRGDSSDKDQALVEKTASELGHEVISFRLDPLEAKGVNFQNWARNRRYRIFRGVKEESGADAIVTAHHQDDQLETVIQKILRGAGLTAWQGMKVWNGELFRPLLEVSKAEILRYASANGVPYRLDSSNEESTYARNFLRNGWFPVLDDLFPGWRDNILKVPDRAREHEALVESLVRSMTPEPGVIDRQRLLAISEEIRRPLLLQILKKTEPEITVSGGSLQNLDGIGSLQTGKRIGIDERWELLRDRDRFVIRERSGEKVFEAVEISREAAGSGELELEDFLISLEEWDGEIRPEELQLDAGKLVWPLTVRSWEQGDQINPFGMEGSQNVSDLLTNRKISPVHRKEARVLQDGEGKIAAVLFPADEERPGTISNGVRCDAETGSVLTLRRAARERDS